MENEIPDRDELQLLKDMVWKTVLSEDKRILVFESINKCMDYKEYDRLKYKLENLSQDINLVPNPNQGDINRHIRKFCKI